MNQKKSLPLKRLEIPTCSLTSGHFGMYIRCLTKSVSENKGRARWQKEYKLNEVFTFDSIENFWRLNNNITNVKDIVANTDYLLFKQGIMPEWEDPRNNDGGKWVVTIPIDKHMDKEIEEAWLQITLMMIGANIDKELYEIINGAIYSIRDMHLRISVWLSDNSEPSLLKKIGDRLRELSKLPSEFPF